MHLRRMAGGVGGMQLGGPAVPCPQRRRRLGWQCHAAVLPQGSCWQRAPHRIRRQRRPRTGLPPLYRLCSWRPAAARPRLRLSAHTASAAGCQWAAAARAPLRRRRRASSAARRAWRPGAGTCRRRRPPSTRGAPARAAGPGGAAAGPAHPAPARACVCGVQGWGQQRLDAQTAATGRRGGAAAERLAGSAGGGRVPKPPALPRRRPPEGGRVQDRGQGKGRAAKGVAPSGRDGERPARLRDAGRRPLHLQIDGAQRRGAGGAQGRQQQCSAVLGKQGGAARAAGCRGRPRRLHLACRPLAVQQQGAAPRKGRQAAERGGQHGRGGAPPAARLPGGLQGRAGGPQHHAGRCRGVSSQGALLCLVPARRTGLTGGARRAERRGMHKSAGRRTWPAPPRRRAARTAATSRTLGRMWSRGGLPARRPCLPLLRPWPAAAGAPRWPPCGPPARTPLRPLCCGKSRPILCPRGAAPAPRCVRGRCAVAGPRGEKVGWAAERGQDGMGGSEPAKAHPQLRS